jgi:hypothetical protein
MATKKKVVLLNDMVNFSIRAKDKKALQKQAKRLGMPLAELCRNWLLASLEKSLASEDKIGPVAKKRIIRKSK